MTELRNKPIQVAEHKAGVTVAQRINPVLALFYALRTGFGLTRNYTADALGTTPGIVRSVEYGTAPSFIAANLLRRMRLRMFNTVAPRSNLN